MKFTMVLVILNAAASLMNASLWLLRADGWNLFYAALSAGMALAMFVQWRWERDQA